MVHRCCECERFTIFSMYASRPLDWIIAIALIFEVQLNLLCHWKKKNPLRKCTPDCRNISRELRLSSLSSYCFSWRCCVFFIVGNSVFSLYRVFHKQDNVICLKSASFFFFVFVALELVSALDRGTCPTLWLSSSPAVEIFTRAWRVLCARTPLRASTKKILPRRNNSEPREENERWSS